MARLVFWTKTWRCPLYEREGVWKKKRVTEEHDDMVVLVWRKGIGTVPRFDGFGVLSGSYSR